MLIFFHNNNKIGKHGAHTTHATQFKWIFAAAVAATDAYTLPRMQSIETISSLLCVEPQKFYPILASISAIFSHMVASWLL